MCLAIFILTAVSAVIFGKSINMSEKKTRCGKITKMQKAKLIDLMKIHKNVAMGNFGDPNSAKLSRNVCEALAVELNSAGEACKTAEQWKKSWADCRCAVKKQQAEMIVFERRTGNFPASEGPALLHEIDAEVLQFFPSAMLEGDDRTKEAGFIELHTTEVRDEGEEEEMKNDSNKIGATKGAPSPKPSTSRAHSTFKSSFDEIKNYIKEQDKRQMAHNKNQTNILSEMLLALKSIDN